jgi:hypothetical protein
MRIERLIAMVFVLALASPALAHDRDDVRRVIVSVERDAIDVLVVHEITDARRVRMLRSLSLRGVGRMERFARLAELQAFEPRVRQGLAIAIDGERQTLRLEDLEVADGARESSGRASLLVMARYSIARSADSSNVAVQNLGAIGRVVVEMQVAPELDIERTNLSERAGDPVVGPRAIEAGAEAAIAFTHRR